MVEAPPPVPMLRTSVVCEDWESNLFDITFLHCFGVKLTTSTLIISLLIRCPECRNNTIGGANHTSAADQIAVHKQMAA
ncbi:hypothetical protein F8M41_001682 [Gigaspora margarita]|uniref:Uncharacterized protein n=1 Tax=Gigaspora margarita TaxID=4874 RepID=A0A8H3XE05_GIGMA|nr:hypothetical protein F8M41_001682 [Gigaspora margarita]